MLKLFAGAALAALVGIGAAVASPIDAYGRLPAMSDVSISANGADIAYIANEGGAATVVAMGLDGTVLQSANLGPRKVRAVSWVDGTHVMIQVSTTVGIANIAYVGEWYQALSLNVKTGAMVQLPSGSEQSVLNVMMDTPHGGTLEGKPVIWASLYAKEAQSWQDDGHLDFYRMDPETGMARKQQMGDAETKEFLAKSDGTVLARVKYRAKDGAWRLELRHGGWEQAYSEIAPIDQPDLVGRSLDEKSVILTLWDEKNDRWRLAPFALADGKQGEFFGPDKPFGTITDEERRLVGLSYTDVYTEYDFFEPRLKAIWPQVRQVFAGRQVSLTSNTPDYAKLIVYVEGTGEPGGYYLVDLGAKKVKRIGAAYPALTSADIATVKAIKYKAADGLEISGYLTLPNGRAPKGLPLIVMPHGGPQSRDTAGFDWWAQALASRGYAVLQANFRGSSGYGHAFIEAAYGEWGAKMQTDLSDGVRYLAQQGVVDPKRVCIAGASYGGYAALAGITLDKGVYRCAVAVAGVSDMAQMLAKESSQSGPDSTAVRYWKRYMGVERSSDPKLRERSPVNFADKADGPVLLIHGKDDTVVYYDQSVAMRRALEKAKKPVEFVTLKAEDHWLSREGTRQQMLSETVAFLEKHNPPN
ncbi:alpha/beta hydrolase family protein [Caulobacter sp. DWR3-1-2]|uniref:alpha/beta hydrolase family protein n=1 Tax=Caulobacter sp. DWR3-1-2 TaxID=2804647 RepID=UPI003CF5DA9E